MRLVLIAGMTVLATVTGCAPTLTPNPVTKATPPSTKANAVTSPSKVPSATDLPAPVAKDQKKEASSSAPMNANATPPAIATTPPASPVATDKAIPPASEPNEKQGTNTDSTQLAAAATTSVLKEKGAEPTKTEASKKAGVTADKKPAERVLLLSPGGPLVIDVVLRLEGQDFNAALSRLADEAFRIADEDGDGKTTWEDLANNPKFRSGEFGNLVADTEEERRQLIRIYDVDKDQLVDREELPRFLTRNAGGGKSFSLRSSNEYRGTNRRRSPTRLLIDADRDGAITEQELAAAPALLLNRDADNDEIVLLSEVKDSVTDMMQQPQMMANRRRVTEPDTAIWLTDKAVDMSKRWGMVQFQLQELYSFGEQIGPGDWPLTPELYKALDADANGELAKGEFAKLLTISPHFILDLNFESQGDGDRSPTIKILEISSEMMAMKPVVRELRSRISIQLPNTEVELFVNQDPSLTNVAQAAKGQFAALDRNQNGYLEKDEVPEMIPGIGVSFAQIDRDGDEKVYEKELAEYLEQRVSVTRAQVRARAADQEDALFTALDTDADGRLNTREIRLAPVRIKALDHNQDGLIQSDEIPGSMVIGFIRGNPQQDDQLLSANALLASTADSSLPRWFRGMDANHDGEISPREFFGTKEKFARVDSDGDGFITIEEGKAFEAVVPSKTNDQAPMSNDQ